MPSSISQHSLYRMRDEAMRSAHDATDPLVAQQYRDLAKSYAAAIDELRATGITIVPQHDASQIPWRSILLRSENDR